MYHYRYSATARRLPSRVRPRTFGGNLSVHRQIRCSPARCPSRMHYAPEGVYRRVTRTACLTDCESSLPNRSRSSLQPRLPRLPPVEGKMVFRVGKNTKITRRNGSRGFRSSVAYREVVVTIVVAAKYRRGRNKNNYFTNIYIHTRIYYRNNYYFSIYKYIYIYMCVCVDRIHIRCFFIIISD